MGRSVLAFVDLLFGFQLVFTSQKRRATKEACWTRRGSFEEHETFTRTGLLASGPSLLIIKLGYHKLAGVPQCRDCVGDELFAE